MVYILVSMTRHTKPWKALPAGHWLVHTMEEGGRIVNAVYCEAVPWTDP